MVVVAHGGGGGSKIPLSGERTSEEGDILREGIETWGFCFLL